MEVILSVEQMRRSDKTAIEEIGIPGLILMENAGLKSAQSIADAFGPVTDKRITVVCGKGNNGGDGFVIGRHLHQMGAKVEFLLMAKNRGEVRGDAKVNLEIAAESGLPISEIHQADRAVFADSDLVVDALLGTGLKGEVRGPVADLISAINGFPGPVVAIDAPSGLNCDNGQPLGVCVQADLTITMGHIKTGMLLFPGRGLLGQLRIADLSVPAASPDKLQGQHRLPEYEDYRAMLPSRPRDGHKNKFGKILVLAGSPGLTGAAKLCSESVLRSGAGMVVLGCPATLNPIFETSLTEVMTVPLPDSDAGGLTPEALRALKKHLDWCDIVALGPGLGTDPGTKSFVLELIKSQSRPLVIDADGLNNLAGNMDILADYKHPVVVTPHRGEFGRMTGLTPDEIDRDPVAVVSRYAREWGVVVLLKGATTLIADAEGDVFFNLSGNSGLATAGSGDVLTGLIAGFMGQGLDATSAAVLAAFVHGASGHLVSGLLGERGMTAGDILDHIPATLKEIEEQETGPIAQHLKALSQRLF